MTFLEMLNLAANLQNLMCIRMKVIKPLHIEILFIRACKYKLITKEISDEAINVLYNNVIDA